ncbi:hypothetical protein [Aeromicrobium sp. 179-A 4D2 NHS]|uniref:hypothetical protein n=1 Tax=Aeromicrobium sp. 179-A 4D2 NHS TaxID=3142375 RepID=UPI0039A03E72
MNDIQSSDIPAKGGRFVMRQINDFEVELIPRNDFDVDAAKVIVAKGDPMDLEQLEAHRKHEKHAHGSWFENMTEAEIRSGAFLYGWHDRKAQYHCKPVDQWNGDGCHWVMPDGTPDIREYTYSMFGDTIRGNDTEVGIELSGVSCACGQYENQTLRIEGTVGDLLDRILNA